MTDLAREMEIAEWLGKAIGKEAKGIDKWGFSELGHAGIFMAIRSAAENERHHVEVERFLSELVELVRLGGRIQVTPNAVYIRAPDTTGGVISHS